MHIHTHTHSEDMKIKWWTEGLQLNSGLDQWIQPVKVECSKANICHWIGTIENLHRKPCAFLYQQCWAFLQTCSFIQFWKSRFVWKYGVYRIPAILDHFRQCSWENGYIRHFLRDWVTKMDEPQLDYPISRFSSAGLVVVCAAKCLRQCLEASKKL